MRDWVWENFSPDEMRCKGTGGMLIVSAKFMDSLQTLREEFSRPMRLTSACRSAAHNKSVGGHPRSLHICDEPSRPEQQGCLAVDVAVPDGSHRGHLVATAWRLGWSVGWNRTFVHLDRRDFVALKQTTFDY